MTMATLFHGILTLNRVQGFNAMNKRWYIHTAKVVCYETQRLTVKSLFAGFSGQDTHEMNSIWTKLTKVLLNKSLKFHRVTNKMIGIKKKTIFLIALVSLVAEPPPPLEDCKLCVRECVQSSWHAGHRFLGIQVFGDYLMIDYGLKCVLYF